MPGNIEFRLTACINSPAIFSIKIRSVSYPGLTPCNFLMLGIASILMLKSRIPKERRKGRLRAHRSCSLPKILSIKYVIHRRRILQIHPVLHFKKNTTAHYRAVAMEGRKKTATARKHRLFLHRISTECCFSCLHHIPQVKKESLGPPQFCILIHLYYVCKRASGTAGNFSPRWKSKNRGVWKSALLPTRHKELIFCYGSVSENVFSSWAAKQISFSWGTLELHMQNVTDYFRQENKNNKEGKELNRKIKVRQVMYVTKCWGLWPNQRSGTDQSLCWQENRHFFSSFTHRKITVGTFTSQTSH